MKTEKTCRMCPHVIDISLTWNEYLKGINRAECKQVPNEQLVN